MRNRGYSTILDQSFSKMTTRYLGVFGLKLISAMVSKVLSILLLAALLPLLNTAPASGAAPDSAPVIGTIRAGNGYLEVPFTDASTGVTNYEYSVDGGISWSSRTPAATWSPLNIPGLVNGTTYSVKLRGKNADGVSTASTAVSATPNSLTQLASSQAFLQGSYVEVGVRANGAFGSSTIPAGFHGTVGTCLGFRVDRQKNGWGSTVGASAPFTNIDDGDYFCPGTQYEGWGLQVDTNSPTFNNHSATGITGTVINAVNGDSSQSSEWNAASPSNGITVKQIASVPNVGQSLHVDVTLTNNSGSTINNIYYVRGFDPDNSTGSANGLSSVAASINKINSVGGPDSVAELQATFDSGALVMMRSTDSRARASIRTSDCCSPALAVPKTVWDGSAEWIKTTDALTSRDAQVAISFKIDSLAAGSSTTFRVSYVLSANEASSPTATTAAATNVGAADTATLNSTVNANGSATTVEFEYGTSSDLSGSNTLVTATSASGSSPTSISKNIEGLTVGTTYYFRVIATNTVGATRGSIFSFTPIALPQLTIVAASGIGDNIATLNAAINPKGGSATQINFIYGPNSSLTSDTSTVSASPSTASGTSTVSVSANISSLSPGVTYFYKITAQNEAGTASSSTLSFTTTPAPAVTTLDATNVTATSSTLNGTVNPFGVNTTELIFQYSTVADLSSSVLTVNTTPSSASDSSVNNVSASLSGLVTGTTYYYRTKATTANGTNFGAIKSFTVKARPSVVTATPDVSGTTVTFNGVINPNGATTTSITATYSELSPTLSSDTATVSISPFALSGASNQNVSYVLRGLSSSTTYYVRFSATNSEGTTNGEIVSFTTDFVDSVAPTGTISTTSDSFGKTENIVVTVTFSEPVTGFASSDLVLGGSSTGWAKGSAVATSTSVYTITLTPSSASAGTLTLDVAANSVVDNSGNNNTVLTRKSLTINDSVALPVLSYSPDSINATVSTAITSLTPTNTGGMVDTWSISPSLPAGLRISSSTGVISGTPTATSSAATYTITGTNATGSSTTQISVEVLAAATVPDAPVIGTATSTGSTTATVSFVAPASNGGATITSFTATSSPGGITGSLSQAGSGTISIAGLTPGTDYTFTVVATNSVGNSLPSAASNQITTTSGAVTLTPPAPVISEITTSSFVLSFTLQTGTVSVTAKIYESDGTTLVGAIRTSFVSGSLIDQLQSRTTYKVSLTAIGNGTTYITSAESALISVTLPVPTPPSYLKALTYPKISTNSIEIICESGDLKFMRFSQYEEKPKIDSYVFEILEDKQVVARETSVTVRAIFEMNEDWKGSVLHCAVTATQENISIQTNSLQSPLVRIAESERKKSIAAATSQFYAANRTATLLKQRQQSEILKVKKTSMAKAKDVQQIQSASLAYKIVFSQISKKWQDSLASAKTTRESANAAANSKYLSVLQAAGILVKI